MTLTQIPTEPLGYSSREPLRIVTLHQPYASLMAWGEKQVETRSVKWGPPAWGWWAIHASVNRQWALQADVANDSYLTQALWRHDVTETHKSGRTVQLAPWKLPFGCILCLVRCYVGLPAAAAQVSDQERAHGDYYRPGRWAYLTANRLVLPKPIPWKGQQGLPHAPRALRQQIAKALRGIRG